MPESFHPESETSDAELSKHPSDSYQAATKRSETPRVVAFFAIVGFLMLLGVLSLEIITPTQTGENQFANVEQPASSYDFSVPKYDDPRDQAIIDSRMKNTGREFLDRFSLVKRKSQVEARRQQRAYAEQAPPEIVAPVKDLLSSSGDRAEVLGTIRKMTPEQRDETLRLAAGVAQQMGDDRGGAVVRCFAAVSCGLTYRLVNPIMELFGIGGTAKEIGFIRQLDEMALQEFHPYRPSDPWYERMPLEAIEMLPLAFLSGALVFFTYRWKARSATQSSAAPTLLSTHSDSSSSDPELESLKKKNEELKRKVEARKLAEKHASDKVAIEAENARLMVELGDGIENSEQSSHVHPSGVANKNLADRKISGVGGWLALLVVGLLVLGPLLSIFKTGSNIWVAEMQNPDLASVRQWQIFKLMTWCVVGNCVVYSVVSGFLLCKKKEPASVKIAIAFLWIGNPVAAFVLGILIPWISFGTAALEEMLPRSIGAIVGSRIAATIWTAYLRKSKRVKNTYFP